MSDSDRGGSVDSSPSIGGGSGVAWALNRLSRGVTFDSKAEMVLWAAACCAWNELARQRRELLKELTKEEGRSR